MNYKNFGINKSNNYLTWSKILKKSFDFNSGLGVAQLNIKNLFSKKDCENMYKDFSSNLNWIVRDGQKLKVLKRQTKVAKKLLFVMKNLIKVLQKNIPEKNHVHLILETLRVARSDGTQHQVGSRWHQDHEAYFSLLINLTSNFDPNFSTRFFSLESKEKYKLDNSGNPIIQKHWKEKFIKPFHLGIINSGVRYFLFPYDKCRPIVHHAPKLSSKRLAVFATFSISGVEQGMDLKDIYIPVSRLKNTQKKNKNLLNLRNHWRKILGIKNSIPKKNYLRISKSKFGLYKIAATKFNLSKNNKEKKFLNNQPRIVNFGLKQFLTSIDSKKKLLNKALPIGELSRTLNFFSFIGKYSVNKLKKNKNLGINLSDVSLFGNNNYDLFVQFKQPKKAFQFLKMHEVKNHINSFVLVLYPFGKNFFFNKKKCNFFNTSLPFERKKNINNIKFFNKKKSAQVFTSFSLSNSLDTKKSFLMSYSLKNVWKQGIKEIVINKKNRYFLINKKNFNNKININLNKNMKKSTDLVPFFLPRVGIDRILPEINSSSKLFKSSKKILSI